MEKKRCASCEKTFRKKSKFVIEYDKNGHPITRHPVCSNKCYKTYTNFLTLYAKGNLCKNHCDIPQINSIIDELQKKYYMINHSAIPCLQLVRARILFHDKNKKLSSLQLKKKKKTKICSNCDKLTCKNILINVYLSKNENILYIQEYACSQKCKEEFDFEKNLRRKLRESEKKKNV